MIRRPRWRCRVGRLRGEGGFCFSAAFFSPGGWASGYWTDWVCMGCVLIESERRRRG